MEWFVYILACRDGSYYTGIATDVAARVAEHTKGKGAKYTRGRGPFTILRVECYATKSEALIREAAIKRLSKSQKRALCS